jgi:hypothetical protein
LRARLAAVQYQVRLARITDAERIVTLLERAPSSGAVPERLAAGSGDLLRQLVGLPHAVVLVAETGRTLVGAGILALRPSVQRGGFVGTIDVLATEATGGSAAVVDALLTEILRSARNKGCVAVEAPPPADPAERARWLANGFHEAGPTIVREIAPAGATRT